MMQTEEISRICPQAEAALMVARRQLLRALALVAVLALGTCSAVAPIMPELAGARLFGDGDGVRPRGGGLGRLKGHYSGEALRLR